MADTREWWNEERALDTLRLSPDEYFVLVSRLDSRHGERRGPDQRTRTRIRYWRRRTVVLVRHVNGSRIAYDVKPHNISRTGIAFLHGFYIHPNTDCETALWTVDKEPVAIRGKVVRCRHLQGKTHEVGVQFNEPIDLREFLADYVPPEGEVIENPGVQRFSGRVLFVDDSVDNRELVGYIAGELGVALRTATCATEGLEAAAKTRFDIVVAKGQLPDSDVAALAKALRDAGYAGTIVAFGDSGETSADKTAGQAGECDRVLRSPITLEGIAALFRDYLPRETDAELPLEPLISTHWTNVGMRPFILKFVARLQERIGQLQGLLAQQQLDDFRKACRDFKGSAESYGYAPIGGLLQKLDALAASNVRPERLQSHMAELARLCGAAGRVCPDPDQSLGARGPCPPQHP